MPAQVQQLGLANRVATGLPPRRLLGGASEDGGPCRLPAASPHPVPPGRGAQAASLSAAEATTGAKYITGNGMCEYQRALTTVTTAPMK